MKLKEERLSTEGFEVNGCIVQFLNDKESHHLNHQNDLMNDCFQNKYACLDQKLAISLPSR